MKEGFLEVLEYVGCTIGTYDGNKVGNNDS